MPLLILGILSAFYAVSVPSLYASSDTHSSGGHGEDHGGGHGEEHGGGDEHGGEHGEDHGGGHHAPAPPIYYLMWILTLAIVFVTLLGWRKVNKDRQYAEEHADHEEEHGGGHHGPEFKGALKYMGTFLVIAVFFLFLIEGFNHWHEPNGLGFLRFVLRFVTGIALMFWGIVFMHHEEEEEDDNGHGGGHGDAHGGGHGH